MTNTIDNISEDVIKLLNKLGVPQHVKGYWYIAYGIEILADNPSKADSIMKSVYLSIAVAFNTTISKVERAMRHAITLSFDSVGIDTVQELFGNALPIKKDKLTNSQFLVTVAYKVRRARLAVAR